MPSGKEGLIVIDGRCGYSCLLLAVEKVEFSLLLLLSVLLLKMLVLLFVLEVNEDSESKSVVYLVL